MAPNNNNNNPLHCPYCPLEFRTRGNLRRHINNIHRCYHSHRNYVNRLGHLCRRRIVGRGGEGPFDSFPFTRAQSSLDGVFSRYQLNISEISGSIEQAFRNNYQSIVSLLVNILQHMRNAKVHFVVTAEMQEMRSQFIQLNYLSSGHYIYRHRRDIKINMFQTITDIVNVLNLFVANGSSWEIIDIIRIDVYVAQIRSVRVGHKVPLPTILKGRRGIINIQAAGNRCFHNSVICAYLKLKPADSRSLRPYKEFEKRNLQNCNQVLIKWTSVSNPLGVSISEIDSFEVDNPETHGYGDTFRPEQCDEEKVQIDRAVFNGGIKSSSFIPQHRRKSSDGRRIVRHHR
jgi:hypothetical protein